MKRIIAAAAAIAAAAETFAAAYRIGGTEYDIRGMTKVHQLERKVQVDTVTVFRDEESFLEYIRKLRQEYDNTRAFENVGIDYSISSGEGDTSVVTLKIRLEEGFSFLTVPYLTFSTPSSGAVLTPKIKVKDSNFLGSMNPLTASMDLVIRDDFTVFEPEVNFTYDHPFEAGGIKFIWTNDHTVSYTWGKTSPEWNLRTGLSAELPFRLFSLKAEFYQSSTKDFDYDKYGDGTYFTEEAALSAPFTLLDIDGFSKIYSTPKVSFVWNWDPFIQNGDLSGISGENTDLSGPYITVGNTFSTSKVDWNGNFRDGWSLSLSPSIKYNFQLGRLEPESSCTPGITFDMKGYRSFGIAGITGSLHGFFYGRNGSEKFDAQLRGIRGDQDFSGETAFSGDYACKPQAGIVLNLDVPVRILSTDFSKGIFRYLNFDVQMSPFMDIALMSNKATGSFFDPKDGFYAAGLDILVYPRKWTGYTIRASLGLDVGRLLLRDVLNMDWRQDEEKWWELYIGLGLHY